MPEVELSQESFYGKHKVDLGDSNRFETLGELAHEIYRTVWVYNHIRIHSALKMAPVEFARIASNAIVSSYQIRV